MLKGMNRSGSPSKRPFCAKNLAKLVLFVAVGIGAICQTGCSGTTTPASKDEISNAGQFGPSTSSVNLGNVALGDSKTVSVTFTNSTSSAVTILTISISGPGFTASGIPSGTILNPGDMATLNVTFAPSGTGTQTGSVTVTSNASTSSITVALQASGVPAGDHSATLSWNASPSGVAGYFVYRATNGGRIHEAERKLRYKSHLHRFVGGSGPNLFVRGYSGEFRERREQLLQRSDRNHSHTVTFIPR